MILEAVLQKYRSRGMYPYENWASDHESFSLLKDLWFEVFEKYNILKEFDTDQEVFQAEGSYIVSLRSCNKHILVYPLPQSAEYDFDFYLKPVLDADGNSISGSARLVIDCKLSSTHIGAAVDLLKRFEECDISCESDRDNVYDSFYSTFGHLLAYQRDGT